MTAVTARLDFTLGFPGVVSASITAVSGVIALRARKDQCGSPSLTPCPCDSGPLLPEMSTLPLRGRSTLPQPRELSCVSAEVETAVYEKPFPPSPFMRRVPHGPCCFCLFSNIGCCCCSVSQACLTLCDPMDCSSLSFTISQSLFKLMPSNHLILSSPSPPAFYLSQHQRLFQ